MAQLGSLALAVPGPGVGIRIQFHLHILTLLFSSVWEDVSKSIFGWYFLTSKTWPPPIAFPVPVLSLPSLADLNLGKKYPFGLLYTHSLPAWELCAPQGHLESGAE